MHERQVMAAASGNGFTLFEVLIAMAILALAMPILLGLRNWDLDLHARAADITAATMLAQEKLIEAELSPVYPVGETSGDFRNPDRVRAWARDVGAEIRASQGRPTLAG